MPPPCPPALRPPAFAFVVLAVSAAALAWPVRAADPAPPASPAAIAAPVPAPPAGDSGPTPAAAAASATPSPAPAATPGGHNPLDATPQEIARLYGPVLKRNARVRNHQVLEGGTILDGDLHGHNGFVIRAVYHQGHTVLLEYTRVGGALTMAEVNVLLTAAAGDLAWVPGKDNTDAAKFYRRSDGRAVASYVTANDGSLIIAAEGPDRDKFLDNIPQ